MRARKDGAAAVRERRRRECSREREIKPAGVAASRSAMPTRPIYKLSDADFLPKPAKYLPSSASPPRELAKATNDLRSSGPKIVLINTCLTCLYCLAFDEITVLRQITYSGTSGLLSVLLCIFFTVVTPRIKSIGHTSMLPGTQIRAQALEDLPPCIPV